MFLCPLCAERVHLNVKSAVYANQNEYFIFLLNLLSVGTVAFEFGMLLAELRVWNVVDKVGKKNIIILSQIFRNQLKDNADKVFLNSVR